MFWFKHLDIHAFLEGLSLLCKYTGFSKHDPETDRRNNTIIMRHVSGEKW